jgi:hypothetical protein
MELIFTERMRICMASHDLGGLQFGLLLSQEEFETRIPIPGTGKVKKGLKHAFFVWI